MTARFRRRIATHPTIPRSTTNTGAVQVRKRAHLGINGAAYRSINQKDVLHLALLLHDVGKGKVIDHCIVGEEIARRIGPRLTFSPEETEQIAFLIRQHLEMADLAFRRDISDEKLLVKFSHLVGSQVLVVEPPWLVNPVTIHAEIVKLPAPVLAVIHHVVSGGIGKCLIIFCLFVATVRSAQ